MATAVKRILSGSTSGMAIKIAAIVSPGTLIHTAVAGSTPGTYDEVWLWAFNSDTVDRLLTIEFGGYTAPDQNIIQTIPSKVGLYPVLPGWILQGGLVVSAFAAATNVITLGGFVNSITD